MLKCSAECTSCLWFVGVMSYPLPPSPHSFEDGNRMGKQLCNSLGALRLHVMVLINIHKIKETFWLIYNRLPNILHQWPTVPNQHRYALYFQNKWLLHLGRQQSRSSRISASVFTSRKCALWRLTTLAVSSQCPRGQLEEIRPLSTYPRFWFIQTSQTRVSPHRPSVLLASITFER